MITIPADTCPRCGTVLLIRLGPVSPEEELAKVLGHVCGRTATTPRGHIRPGHEGCHRDDNGNPHQVCTEADR